MLLIKSKITPAKKKLQHLLFFFSASLDNSRIKMDSQMSTDSRIEELQRQVTELRLQNEKLQQQQLENSQKKKANLTACKKMNRWTCFNAHMMKILNSTLVEESVPQDVQKELCIRQMENGTVLSNYNDKNSNESICLRELGAYSGNVQGIMKHCGRLWANLPSDVKLKWTEYATDLNSRNQEQRQFELNSGSNGGSFMPSEGGLD